MNARSNAITGETILGPFSRDGIPLVRIDEQRAKTLAALGIENFQRIDGSIGVPLGTPGIEEDLDLFAAEAANYYRQCGYSDAEIGEQIITLLQQESSQATKQFSALAAVNTNAPVFEKPMKKRGWLRTKMDSTPTVGQTLKWKLSLKGPAYAALFLGAAYGITDTASGGQITTDNIDRTANALSWTYQKARGVDGEEALKQGVRDVVWLRRQWESVKIRTGEYLFDHATLATIIDDHQGNPADIKYETLKRRPDIILKALGIFDFDLAVKMRNNPESLSQKATDEELARNFLDNAKHFYPKAAQYEPYQIDDRDVLQFLPVYQGIHENTLPQRLITGLDSLYPEFVDIRAAYEAESQTFENQLNEQAEQIREIRFTIDGLQSGIEELGEQTKQETEAATPRFQRTTRQARNVARDGANSVQVATEEKVEEVQERVWSSGIRSAICSRVNVWYYCPEPD